jgi:hypothetical protein
VPRTPDEAAIQVDSLGERVGLAWRGDESDLADPRLEAAEGPSPLQTTQLAMI